MSTARAPGGTTLADPQIRTPAPPRPPKPKKGGDIELTMDSLAFGGRAVGRLDGMVVFVPHAAPGDRVRARVTKSKSSWAEADLVEVLAPAPERVPPPCDHFGRCGGCNWQMLPYAEQTRWKERIIHDALRPVRAFHPAEIVVDPVVESPDPLHYRNKMEFTFGQEGPDAPLKLGFHLPGNWKHILDIGKCWLMPEPLNALLEASRREGARQRLGAWNPVRSEGMLRQLMIRWSAHEGRALVALLTGERNGLDFDAFRRALTDACPQVKGFVWGVNAGRSDVARAESVVATWGEDTLDERIGPLKFRVSLNSFFQTNSRGAAKLYGVAKEYLSLTGRERLFDAYCGTGTIGIFCADAAAEVYGIELVLDAVRDARENAAANGLSNCTFMAGDMAEALPKLQAAVPGRFDRLVVDPPRSGMEKKALQRLVAMKAPVLVYVSCNPTTMARDMEEIVKGGYRIERVRPVDMFPQTYHIECVARCVLEQAAD